jgi:CubicO group peptidase (beta-lactamase class C family)
MLTFLASFGEPSVSSAALPTMLATRRTGPGIPQALGWWIVATGLSDQGILVHDGGTLGFSSSVAYDVETRTGVVVLSNGAAAVGDIARHILRPVIPLPHQRAPRRRRRRFTSIPYSSIATRVAMNRGPALSSRSLAKRMR